MPLKAANGRNRSRIKAQVQCCFCHFPDNAELYGQLLTDSKAKISAHYFCLLFAAGLPQNGDEDTELRGFLPKDIRTEVRRGGKLKCTFCKKKGATVGCCNDKCKIKYHYGCGKSNDVMFLYKDSFSSYCLNDRPLQNKLSRSDRFGFKINKTGVCYICYNSITTRVSDNVIRAPCCTRPWFHRTCLEKMSYSAGVHFLRCPLCNEQEAFQAELLDFGIYIPDRDAAWEMEPTAFDSLLERHSSCDQPVCLCPDGRNIDKDDSDWELYLCSTCGSSGTHFKCATDMRRYTWNCQLCTAIILKLEEDKKKRKRGSIDGSSTKRSRLVESDELVDILSVD